MGASGKMDAEIPPDAGEQCLRFRLRPAVRIAGFYSVVGVTAVANSSFLCTRSDHVGDPEPFNVVLGTGLSTCPMGACTLYRKAANSAVDL